MPNTRPHLFAVLALAALAILAGQGGPARADPTDTDHWVQAWGASLHQLSADKLPKIQARTLIQSARVSIGGNAARIKISNEAAKDSLKIGAASVVLKTTRTCENCNTPIKLTFGGSPSIEIPPGAPALSDALALPIPALSELEIRLYVEDPSTLQTGNNLMGGAAQISAPGDYTSAKEVPIAQPLNGHALLSGIEVRTDRTANVVIAIGDSLTRGLHVNQCWPDRFAERAASSKRSKPISIVNAGIGGDMLMHGDIVNGQARFNRDVLAATGATHVILLMGTNDIGRTSIAFRAPNQATTAITAKELIGAYEQMIARAHAHGLKIYAGTIMPFSGAEKTFPGYYTDEGEKVRLEVNHWIRNSKKFDAVIDFDQIMRDPINTNSLSPKYDSGDHLHTNPAGDEAMANAIDLSLFE